MDYYAALMEAYGWTLDQIDQTDLSFLLDMTAVKYKKHKFPKKRIGNADDIAFL